MSLIWPLTIAFGIGLGIVLSLRRKPREVGLGLPLLVVLLASALLWVLEGYLAIGGLGHYGAWIFAYALLFGLLASFLYLASYVVTRAICDRAYKGSGHES